MTSYFSEFAPLWEAAFTSGWLPASLVFMCVVAGVWLVGKVLSAGRSDDDSDSSRLIDALAAQTPVSEADQSEFQKLLRSAGMYDPGAAKKIYALRFALLVAPLLIAGAFAVAAPSQYTPACIVAGVAAAGLLSVSPRLYVFFRSRRRQRSISASLPDALDMLSMCIGGGMPLAPALAYVAGKLPGHPELAQELTIVKRQMDVGGLGVAVKDFAARVQIPEAKQLAAVLTRGQELGAALSPSLNNQADRLRESRRQSAIRQANKAPAKLVLPVLLCLAPAALLLLVAPAMLELADFISPTNAESALNGNESLGMRPLLSTLDSLDQGS